MGGGVIIVRTPEERIVNLAKIARKRNVNQVVNLEGRVVIRRKRERKKEWGKGKDTSKRLAGVSDNCKRRNEDR